MNNQLKLFARRILPVATRRKIVKFTRWPPIGFVRFGSFRRLEPISRNWGMERGNPIDRYYIERFLANHAGDIRGRVLEIGTDLYTLMFGDEHVVKSDVLHVAENKPEVTIIGDLTTAENIPSDSYECIILTQTLQVIYDIPSVLRTVHRILAPGGIVLVTIPGITHISRYDMDRWGQFWCFTSLSAQRLFESVFPQENVRVTAYGNVLASVALLHGLATEELRTQELDYFDPDYELLIGVRALKAEVDE